MTTLNEALNAVMAEVREVRKTERNQAQKFTFRGIDNVVNAVAGPLRKHKVRLKVDNIEHTITGKQNAKGNPVTFVTVKNRYTWVGPDGQTEENTVVAEAMDFSDKATAKANSVALRTFLLQALMLPTDDADPDHDYIEETRPQQTQPAQQGPNWAEHYQTALAKGPDNFAAFLQWAKKQGGPAEMIQAGEQQLAKHKGGQAVEGEVLTNED